jgi:hypothetical protein
MLAFLCFIPVKMFDGVKRPMNDCKYLMISESTFCRLKGKENPKCMNCSLRSEKNEHQKLSLRLSGQ